jgi:hypothetical protein
MRILLLALAFLVCLPNAWGQDLDPTHIGIHVTPVYSSEGPVIQIGTYSEGLSTTELPQFLQTIAQMKQKWAQLNFLELYVGAIRLYDQGYYDESLYWFYTAQYRSRFFIELLDKDKMGSIGSAGFEMKQMAISFFTLSGPWFNGYGFKDPGSLLTTVERVMREHTNVQDQTAIYPKVNFIANTEWAAANQKVNDGIRRLADRIRTTPPEELLSQRVANGMDSLFAPLISKPLPN